MEAKEIAFWASEMVQELSRLGDYSVEAKATRETLERGPHAHLTGCGPFPISALRPLVYAPSRSSAPRTP